MEPAIAEQKVTRNVEEADSISVVLENQKEGASLSETTADDSNLDNVKIDEDVEMSQNMFLTDKRWEEYR